MKHLKFLITGMLAILFIVSSCKKEDLNVSKDNQQGTTVQQSEGSILLGKELEDPYALKNIKKAYSNLKSTKSGIPDIDIQPTHTYLRFLPKNEEEWSILKSDTSIVLYDYPLNYEIVNLGTYYHDPALPDSSITYQYCVVPIGHKIPNVQNELLYEVYIPSIDDSTNLKSSSVINQFLTELEYESVRLTGNLTESNLKSTKGLLPSKWTPKGTIRVWDNDLGWLPLIQATVHARWFTNVESDLTDNNGYFQTSQFRYEVNYAIKWERADFDIRSENWGQAWYNGPKQKGDWNLDINQGGMSWVYAHIHRGAYTYWYNNTFGIKTPPNDNFWKRKVKIGAFDADGRAFFKRGRRWTTFPEIEIYKIENGSNCRADRIYYTIIHELVHSSHWDLDKSAYSDAPSIVKESWAICAANIITSATYGSDDYDWQNYSFIQIRDPNFLESKYTPVALDLMDNINQRANHSGSTDFPIDRVSGYTLNQIEESLRGAKSLENWRDNLKNKFDNPTENFVDELFQNYIGL